MYKNYFWIFREIIIAISPEKPSVLCLDTIGDEYFWSIVLAKKPSNWAAKFSFLFRQTFWHTFLCCFQSFTWHLSHVILSSLTSQTTHSLLQYPTDWHLLHIFSFSVIPQAAHLLSGFCCLCQITTIQFIIVFYYFCIFLSHDLLLMPEKLPISCDLLLSLHELACHRKFFYYYWSQFSSLSHYNSLT